MVILRKKVSYYRFLCQVLLVAVILKVIDLGFELDDSRGYIQTVPSANIHTLELNASKSKILCKYKNFSDTLQHFIFSLDFLYLPCLILQLPITYMRLVIPLYLNSTFCYVMYTILYSS